MARTVFSKDEVRYMQSQRLARIASVNPQGAPRVVPTGFALNEEAGTIDCGGFDLAATRRWQDVQTNPRVAIVIDDLASTKPWRPRAVMVRGTAETFEEGGQVVGPGFKGAWMRITPTSISSLGLEST